jgi:hypothetical protein
MRSFLSPSSTLLQGHPSISWFWQLLPFSLLSCLLFASCETIIQKESADPLESLTGQTDFTAASFHSIQFTADSSSVEVNWSTDEETTGRLGWRQTGSDWQWTPATNSLAASHSRTASGLNADQQYEIQLLAVDASGNETLSSTFIIRTTAPLTAGPVLADLSYSVESSSITVEFATAAAAACHVQYGTDYSESTAPAPMGMLHSLTVNGLAPAAATPLRISCSDGSASSLSPGFLITTLASDTTAPAVTDLVWSTTADSISLSFDTSEEAVSRIDYGLDNSLAQSTSVSPSQSSHSIPIGGLASNSTYYLQIVVEDAAGNSSSSPILRISLSTPVSGPVLSHFSFTAAPNSIHLDWQSDVPTDSRLLYGTTAALGSQTSLASPLVTSHSRTIGGLTADTLYYIQARSTDSGANQSDSPMLLFRTSAADTQVPRLQSLMVERGTDSISLQWQTDEPADRSVRWQEGSSLSAPLTCCSSAALQTSHSITISGLNGDSLHTIELSHQDASGNEARLVLHVTTLDTTPPAAVALDVNHTNHLVTSPAYTSTQASSPVTLTWNASAEPDFAAYRIYRSGSPAVSASDELLTRITSQTATSFTDYLEDVTYVYYTILVEDTSGNLSAAGGEVAVVRYPIGNVFKLVKSTALTNDYETNVPAASTPSPPHYQAPLYYLLCDPLAESNGGVSTSVKLAANFALYEFVWSSTAHAWNHPSFNGVSEFSWGYAVLDPSMVEHLQSIRSRYGGALTLNSSFRSPSRNAQLYSGSYTSSRHQFGDAVDIANPGGSSAAVWQTITDLATAAYHDDTGYGTWGEGASYVEPYNKTGTWIHADWRYERNLEYSNE